MASPAELVTLITISGKFSEDNNTSGKFLQIFSYFHILWLFSH